MDYADKYSERLNRKGSNSVNSAISKSKYIINKQFTTSPSYTTINLNGIGQDAIITNSNKYDEKVIMVRPDSIIDIGSIVKYKDISYLLISFTEHELSPSGQLKLTNSTYPIKSNKTRVLKGHTDVGKPVYEEVYEIDTVTPCIVESRNYATDTNTQLIIPNNSVLITLKYQQSDTLKENYEFAMYNDKYKIINIDYTKVINEIGIIKILAERV